MPDRRGSRCAAAGHRGTRRRPRMVHGVGVQPLAHHGQGFSAPGRPSSCRGRFHTVGGASAGSDRWRAATNSPRSAASPSGSANSPTTGFDPSSQRHTVHTQGKPHPGWPSARGTGASAGRPGARTGSQRYSRSKVATDQWIRGSRTASRSPSRNIAWSVPDEDTRRTSSAAQSGNCSRSSALTSASSIGTSSSCISVGGGPPITRPLCRDARLVGPSSTLGYIGKACLSRLSWRSRGRRRGWGSESGSPPLVPLALPS